MATSILVVEDQPLLLRSMSRVLGEIPDTEVDAVGTLQAALASVRTQQPELVVADLELPDGCGIDLLQAMCGAAVPFIFVSGFVPAYLERLGQHPSVIVREKPMPMRELQTLALAQIEAGRLTAASPFTVADYVQLACLGRRSVRIDADGDPDDPVSGHVYIHKGGIWAAYAGRTEGADAFYRLAMLEQAQIRCSRIEQVVVSRNVDETSWEHLLLEAARRRDEDDHAAPHSGSL